MNFVKVIMILFVCLSVFSSGMANAAVSCCASDNGAAMEMQMDMDGAQPCHDMADTDNQNMMDCDSCECQHCAKHSALPLHTIVKHSYTAQSKGFGHHPLYSRTLENPFQPPKLIS